MKKEEESKVKPEPSSDDEEMTEAELNWWEKDNLQIAGKGEKRWDTLSHNGVLFPPLYVPHRISIYYEGREFKMTPEEEEVATMFAVMKEHDYYRNSTFRENFFRCWREILDKREHPIRRLELCDFEPIYQWHLREREKKLARTSLEKKQIKMAAEAEGEPYKYCVWDGKREQVANFRVEPPGLFRGRGSHPLTGTLKKRVQPEDITINIGAEAEIPAPPAGHRWKDVQHDNTVTWLAMWRDNVCGNFKYVMLAPSSTVKGQSDLMKFEKARSLKNYIDEIRHSYMDDFKSSSRHVAQRAVAMYFIDKLALRVGNEKGSDEADTVGCCSLRCEHVTLLPDHIVKFDFLGKDSIRYQNEVHVLPEVHALLAKFTRNKPRDADIFDSLNTTQLNDHLKYFMSGLTAKVFRTYNASFTLAKKFKDEPANPKSSIADKLAYFNKANTEVAILCNHQKAVSKNFHTQIHTLKAKSSHTEGIIEQLEKAKLTMKAKSLEAAAKEFFAEQDRIQRAWLEAYGTEEQRKDFEEIVAKRSAPKLRASSSGEKKKASSKKSRSNGKAKKTTKKAAAKASKGKASKKAAPKGKDTHKTVPKRPRRAKAEDSDADDIPLCRL